MEEILGVVQQGWEKSGWKTERFWLLCIKFTSSLQFIEQHYKNKSKYNNYRQLSKFINFFKFHISFIFISSYFSFSHRFHSNIIFDNIHRMHRDLIIILHNMQTNYSQLNLKFKLPLTFCLCTNCYILRRSSTSYARY